MIGSGATLHAALEAADLLAAGGVGARVVDAYSVKPVDAATVLAAAAQTRLIVTVEDHYPEGGLGSAVAEVLADAGSPTRLLRLAVDGVPGSGPSAAIARVAGIDAAGIARAVTSVLSR